MYRVARERDALLADYQDRLHRLGYSRKTQLAYGQAVRRLYRAYPRVALEDLTPEHIERHLYARHLQPASFITSLETLRAYFKWLIQHKRVLARNPCAGVERPRVPDRIRPAPSFAEFQTVRATCRTVEEGAWVEVLYFTGLRITEARLLRVAAVDLEQRRIQLVGKGGRARIVVFPERTAALLRQQIGHRPPGDYLFASPRRPGYPRGSDWLERLTRRLGRVAGLPYPLTAHLLRHGFFRLCKTRGVPLEVASRLGGHRSITTTASIYGQMDADDLQAAYDRGIGS